jgi:hypothetical protein
MIMKMKDYRPASIRRLLRICKALYHYNRPILHALDLASREAGIETFQAPKLALRTVLTNEKGIMRCPSHPDIGKCQGFECKADSFKLLCFQPSLCQK